MLMTIFSPEMDNDARRHVIYLRQPFTNAWDLYSSPENSRLKTGWERAANYPRLSVDGTTDLRLLWDRCYGKLTNVDEYTKCRYRILHCRKGILSGLMISTNLLVNIQRLPSFSDKKLAICVGSSDHSFSLGRSVDRIGEMERVSLKDAYLNYAHSLVALTD